MPAIRLFGDIVLWTIGILAILFFVMGHVSIGFRKGRKKLIMNGIFRSMFTRSYNPLFSIENTQPPTYTCPHCGNKVTYEELKEQEKNDGKLRRDGECGTRRRIRQTVQQDSEQTRRRTSIIDRLRRIGSRTPRKGRGQ